MSAITNFTTVRFVLQVPRSIVARWSSGNSLSWGTSRLDTGARCWLHLWRHWVASSRDVEGWHRAAYNHFVHRTSKLPARTTDHRHHLKVGIYFLCVLLRSVAYTLRVFSQSLLLPQSSFSCKIIHITFREWRSCLSVFQCMLDLPYSAAVSNWGHWFMRLECLVTGPHTT